jgi:hypothetical protein
MANKKFTELASINSTTIVATDVFAVTDISDNQSKKITLADLSSSILTAEVFAQQAGSIIGGLNIYDPDGNGSNGLRATTLFANSGYKAGSYFLDYNNFVNKPPTVGSSPKIVSDLGDLTNNSGFIKYDSTDAKLKYTTNTLTITSDNINEGTLNKFYSADLVNALIEGSFANLFNTYSDSFDNGDVRDSLNETAGLFVDDGQSSKIVISDTSLVPNYSIGDSVRVFGASIAEAVGSILDATNLSTAVTASGFTTTGHGAGDTQVVINYKVCKFDTITGVIGSASAAVPITISKTGVSTGNADVLSAFNTDYFIRLAFTGSEISVANRGLAIYRQVGGAGEYKLLTVLGPKEFGPTGSNLWTDYYTFDYTSWSGKDPLDNTYSSSYPITHFPVTAPTTALRGWADTSISSIDTTTSTNTFTINLSTVLYMNSDKIVSVTHNDTSDIATAISTKVAVNKRNLQLNPKTYIVTTLSLPDNFSLAGSPNVTKILRMPWSGGETGTAHSHIIKSSTTVNSKNISIVGVDIDGNVSNQFTFPDSSSPETNYLLNFGTQSLGVILDRCRIKNSAGGGVFATFPVEIKINTCEISNGSTSDRFAYSPLVIDSGTNTQVIGNIMSNFSDSVNASVTTRGVITNNMIQNCGSGLYVYGSTFLLSSPNVLTGPANEFLPNPDILNSEFDSINITLTNGETFTSPDFKYQENGVDFALDQTATGGVSAEIIHKAFYLQKNASGVESVYGTIKNAADYSADSTIGLKHGVRYTIIDLGTTDFTEGNNAVVNYIGAEFIYDDGASGTRGSALFSGTGTVSSGAQDAIVLSNRSIDQSTKPGEFGFQIDSTLSTKIKDAGGQFSFDTLKAANANHVGMGWSSSYRNEVALADLANGQWESSVAENVDEASRTFDAASSVDALVKESITISNHRYDIGEQVKYKNGGSTVVGGLIDNGVYFVSGCDKDPGELRLADTYLKALGTTLSTANLSINGIAGQFLAVDGIALNVDDRVTITGAPTNGNITTPSYTAGPLVCKVSAVTGPEGVRTGFTLVQEDGTALVTVTGTGAGLVIKRHEIIDLTDGVGTHTLNRAGNNPRYSVDATGINNKYLHIGQFVKLSSGHSGFNTDTGIKYGVIQNITGTGNTRRVFIDFIGGGRIFVNSQPGGGGNGLTPGTTGGTLNTIDTFVMAQGTIT